MKHFSDTPVVDEPIQKQVRLAHGKDFPTKPIIPSLYWHDIQKQLYIALDQWYIVPHGSVDMINGFKSSANIKQLKGNQIPCDAGGTYLIDGVIEGKQITLPAPGVVQGIVYNIKNIGEKYIMLNTGSAEIFIDGRETLAIHQNQTVTVQCYRGQWYILNVYGSTLG